MKSKRQMIIKDIIENDVVETQGDLADKLKEHGLNVTQATVSRDIKEMGLIKVPTGDGRYRYAVPQDSVTEYNFGRLQRLFKEVVTYFDYAENMIVVKTLPGNANAVAIFLDNMRLNEVLGTIAGDDTILIILRDKAKAPEMIERFYQMKS